MSLFGLMGDLENDPFFGSHMRTMRQMNNVMSSLLGDPFDYMGMRGEFGMPAIGFGGRAASASQNSLLPFGGGFPPMPNINRLISNSLDSLGDSHSHSSYSSTVVSMTSGPDGRPHVYKATSSTRSAPGGVVETQKTMCDSRSGTKKMSIGHHIGERGHVIEREQNIHSGDQEERQDFINLDEDDAEDFNREWQNRTKYVRSEIPRITGSASIRNRPGYGDRHSYGARDHSIPAITAGPSRRSKDRHIVPNPVVAARRGIRPVTSTTSAISTRHPYIMTTNVPPKKNRNIKTVSGSPSSDM